MKIVYEDPPNRDVIEARFGPLPDNVIFSYAPCVYVPSGTPLSTALTAHEAVHITQQGDAPEVWWEQYLKDDWFRLKQETEAHIAEWRVVKKLLRDRNHIAREKVNIARRLSSPLYGNLVTITEALRALDYK